VDRLDVRWTDDTLRVQALPAAGAGSVRLELWGGSRKRQLLETIIGVPVEIVAPDGSVVVSSDDEGE
jgi:hypothetical protein